MPSTKRLTRRALLPVAALLALSAAGIVSATASALPAASERIPSSSFASGTQVPAVTLEETPTE